MTEEKTSLQDPHCAHCLKPISHQRLSLRYLISDAFSQLFNLDRGFFFTCIEMLKRPEEVVGAFIEGNRFRYMNPFRLILVSATIAVIMDTITGSSELINAMNIQGEKDNPALDLVRDNIDLIIIAMVPFFTLGSYIVFRKPKWNYAEHLIINAYGLSTIAIFGSLVSLLAMPFPDTIRLSIESFSQLLNLFMVYVFVRTWNYGWIKALLLLILSYLVTIFVVAVCSFMAAFVVNIL